MNSKITKNKVKDIYNFGLTNTLTIRDSEKYFGPYYNYEVTKLDINLKIMYAENCHSEYFKHCLSIFEEVNFDYILMERYGLSTATENFTYLKKLTFVNFFKENSLSTLTCFSKTKSVRRRINEVDIMKLNNYLMRSGKR